MFALPIIIPIIAYFVTSFGGFAFSFLDSVGGDLLLDADRDLSRADRLLDLLLELAEPDGDLPFDLDLDLDDRLLREPDLEREDGLREVRGLERR